MLKKLFTWDFGAKKVGVSENQITAGKIVEYINSHEGCTAEIAGDGMIRELISTVDQMLKNHNTHIGCIAKLIDAEKKLKNDIFETMTVVNIHTEEIKELIEAIKEMKAELGLMVIESGEEIKLTQAPKIKEPKPKKIKTGVKLLSKAKKTTTKRAKK
jgi:hypothetical protein